MKKLTTEEVIKEITAKYDYDTSLVDYKNANEKICLICHHKDNEGIEHGKFYITTGHLRDGHGCPKCGIEKRIDKRKSKIEDFIKKAKHIHGNKYDYSKVKYVNSHTKVCIICPIHGEFWQTPASHLMGRNCPKCSKPCYKYTTEDFVKKAMEVHGDKYNYSKTNYIDAKTKVCIVCPKHGEFWQIPSEHIDGCGCKYCKESHLEGEIRNVLQKNDIKFEYDVRDLEWLKPLTYDFFLPEHNIAIECQGEQHFRIIEHFGGKNDYDKRVERDKKKKILSEKNGIKLLYYSSYKYNNEIITDTNQLIEIIKRWEK